MRGPRGRGSEPRQNGHCIHRWQQADDPDGYRCAYCRAWRPDCPHDWTWLAPDRLWHCRVCGAVRSDASAAGP